MRGFLKTIALALMVLPALLLKLFSGWPWRCFCLVWARAHLGRRAVPADNQILGLINFEGTDRIRLGHNCRIYKGVRLETRETGEIIIGNNVVLSPGTIIVAHQRVSIHDHVMIGEYCSIRDQDHRLDEKNIRQSGYRTSPITIGRETWIGRGSVILKGVAIGEQVVIGSNSVVTRNVPPNEIWVGTPARFLRARPTVLDSKYAITATQDDQTSPENLFGRRV